MAKANKKPPKQALTSVTEQQVVITSCTPDPNPVTISRTGATYPNMIFFSTNDRDRVYKVTLKGKVFVDHNSTFDIDVWYGSVPVHLTVSSTAKIEKFKYKIKASVGPSCAKAKNLPDPPEIIVEA